MLFKKQAKVFSGNDINIMIIGSLKTGKTSFVKKWTKNEFNKLYNPTIVSDFGFKIFENKGALYRIQLWDLTGEDKNSMITRIFAKDAHGCIIIYDATQVKTRKE